MSKDLKDKALILLEETVNKKDFKSINFLLALTALFQHTKTNPRQYIKHIRKAIKFIQRNFNEDYLLISRIENGTETFLEKDNRLFLSFAENLANILNLNEFEREPDQLNHISGKINLGYQRYFKQGNKIIMKFIPEEQTYEMTSNSSLLATNIIKDSKKRNKYKKQLVYFPEKIYDESNLEKLNIQISLFGKENLDIKKIDAITIQNLNNVETAVEILNLK